ncbi:hypothetical protein D3C80_2203610 [compost metagenome]
MTGHFVVEDLKTTLRQKGVQLVVAGRYKEIIEWRRAHGLAADDTLYFPTMRKAVKAFLDRQADGDAGEA